MTGAAKGTDLLGVRATIAGSYERTFRDNLVDVGVLPLQFVDGDSWESLGLDGSERVAIHGLDDLDANDDLTVVAERADGTTVEFPVTAQVGTPAAVRYVESSGIRHLVLRLSHRGIASSLQRAVFSGHYEERCW